MVEKGAIQLSDTQRISLVRDNDYNSNDRLHDDKADENSCDDVHEELSGDKSATL